MFPGLITLRKICNHPDLSTGGPRLFAGAPAAGDEDDAGAEANEFGHVSR